MIVREGFMEFLLIAPILMIGLLIFGIALGRSQKGSQLRPFGLFALACLFALSWWTYAFVMKSPTSEGEAVSLIIVGDFMKVVSFGFWIAFVLGLGIGFATRKTGGQSAS